ncbi:lysyl oxidase family protein [Leifsonia sp. F6_8S_P_1B]|uniref:Lysyl oxidase family protein n=1 Tax=Leifsonia williamsii TaxID=3035919 RepID=A0ABT8KB93_9MICO|nr:lysyl oxidase family protein [Leifsonia williamsii]MDN4614723.1 lysyl oxidase family protein [Leifsonia williamsii]
MSVVVAVVVVVAGFQVVRASATYATPEVAAPVEGGVAGFAFADRNGNKRHDPDEPPLRKTKVSVYSTGNLPLTSVRTDAAGVFRFPRIANVTPGESSVQLHVTPVMEGRAAIPDGVETQLEQAFDVKLGATTTLAVTSYTACDSLDDCPGARLPDLEPILDAPDGYPKPDKYIVDTTEKPGRVLLRFASALVNHGGMLHLVGEPVKPRADGRAVQQRIYGDGVVYLHEAGSFVYHPTHRHIHFGDFERYDLLAEDGTVVRTSDKISFCLTDLWRVEGSPPKSGDAFLNLAILRCDAQEQGVNSGIGDYYGPRLPDQWIDVTGVPSGKYRLRLTLNPEHRLLESDLTNNSIEIPVDYVSPE